MRPDEEYISGVQRGDESLFAELVRTRLDGLLRFAYGFTGVEDAAHDIVNEVFVRVWQLGSEWQPRFGATAYLITAVRYHALNWVKSNSKRLKLYQQYHDSVGTIAQDVSHDVDPTLVACVQREAAKLTERQQLAIRLRYEQDLSMPEVARVLGIGVRPTEKLIARALTTLRAKLRRVQHELNDL